MPLNLSLNALDIDAHYTLPNGTEPLVFLDFVNEAYTADGSGVALASLLTEQGDYGDWQPNDVIHGTGLVGGTTNPGAGGSFPVFTGDALDLILSGCTALYDVTLTANKLFQIELIRWPDFETYYYSTSSDTLGNLIGDNVNDDVPDSAIVAGAHKVALTMIDGKIARSTDGAAIITINPSAAWTLAPTLMAMQVGLGVTVRSVGLYPAQDDADLPGLSAL